MEKHLLFLSFIPRDHIFMLAQYVGLNAYDHNNIIYIIIL